MAPLYNARCCLVVFVNTTRAYIPSCFGSTLRFIFNFALSPFDSCCDLEPVTPLWPSCPTNNWTARLVGPL